MAIRGEFVELLTGPAPKGWDRGHVTVTLKDPLEKVVVEAWRHGAFAVHEVYWPVSGWRLTHAPTGLQIWSCRNIGDALALAERIEPFTAWDEIKEMLPSGTDLYPKVRNVIDGINDATSDEPR